MNEQQRTTNMLLIGTIGALLVGTVFQDILQSEKVIVKIFGIIGIIMYLSWVYSVVVEYKEWKKLQRKKETE